MPKVSTPGNGQKPNGKAPGPTVDPNTRREVGPFVVDSKGTTMIQPVGGETKGSADGKSTITTYPNGSNYQRLDMNGHKSNPIPHGHGHTEGKALIHEVKAIL